MASTAAPTALPTGCFKCGRPGHWSKDCPFNPAGTPGTPASGGGAPAGRPSSSAGGFNGTSGGKFSSSGGFNGSSGGKFSNSGGFNGGNSWRGKASDGKGFQGSKSAPKETVTKERKKRHNLTPELLLSEKGLGYVLEKMPEMVTIKGREDTVVRDLKSLLEGYMHWHSLLLPYFSFDQFVEKVEKVGVNKRVRMCTRELRDKIVYGKEPTGDKDGEAEAGEGASPNNALPKETPAGPENVEDHGISPADDDIFESDEPGLPVNEDDFEDFFRQGVVEPSDNVGRGSVPSGLQRDASPVRKFPSLEGEGATIPPASAPSTTISEAAAARMEANRLQALERAKARRAQTDQL